MEVCAVRLVPGLSTAGTHQHQLPHSRASFQEASLPNNGYSSSVRYLKASSCVFFFNSACSASLSCGGVDLRVGSGTPSCAKNLTFL
jgi:hypothetical protein